MTEGMNKETMMDEAAIAAVQGEMKDVEMETLTRMTKKQKHDVIEAHVTDKQVPKTTRFNVGGTIFEPSSTTLKLYSATMIGRMASSQWNKYGGTGKTNMEPLYIDRDPCRFRYVLDYMRDRKVNLPMTESKNAFLEELAYYGFDDDDIQEDAIVAGSVAEAAQVVGAVVGNVYDELEGFDMSIIDWKKKIADAEKRKKALKVAHGLYLRSNAYPGMDNFTLRVGEAEDFVHIRDSSDDNQGNYGCGIISDYLGRYGLEVVSLSFENKRNKYRSTYCELVLKRGAGAN